MSIKSKVRDSTKSSKELGQFLQETYVSRQMLVACIQEQAAPLLGVIRSYVLRFGLATGADIQLAATEILQETVVEALAHADTYVTTRQPLAWLLGIALNMIRRRRVSQAKQAQRELSLSSLAARYTEFESESDLLEQLISPSENRLEQEVEMRAQVASLLALVSQMLILASIIQREANNRGSMPLIAGVYWNRIEKPSPEIGPYLASDPTVEYARDTDNPPVPGHYWEGLSNSGTGNTVDPSSPWNTYTHAGWPPTPISSPSLAALQAAASPVPTNCYYFLFKPADGSVVCAQTYAQIQQLANEYLGQ